MTKNTLARKVGTKALFPDLSAVIDSTISFNQGDLLYFDGTANLVKKLAAEADAATFLGIAPITVVSGHVKDVYPTDVDGSVAVGVNLAGPEFGDVHKVLLKSADAILPGDAVYADPVSGTNFVSVAGTKIIGIYQGKGLTSATGGTEIEVLIGARFPTDTLKF